MSKIIAIDGPSGAGKGTVADLVARECNLVYIDSGATYRALAFKAIENSIDLDDDISLIKISENIDIRFDRDRKVYLDNQDISDYIRTDLVSMAASKISKIPEVRKNMVKLQRSLASNDDSIMEGRDITTVVFKDAQVKIYLDASIEERARRRYNEYKKKNISCTYEEVLNNIKERDYIDMHKEVGSLMRTKDQIYIDSTYLTIEEVKDKIVEQIKGVK